MSWERLGGLRAAIAQLAAQIMYGEDVKQYFTAKRLAAKRLLGRPGARSLRYRPQDLPSNGEIKAALLELVTEIEGDSRTRRLFAMRVAALEAMADLEPFAPRLIGSVATGHVREGSDVDIHVFAYDAEDVVSHVRGLGWVHEVQHVSIMKHGRPMEFVHVHIPDVFPMELTVYAPRELRIRSRSSTDGKPIVRVGHKALSAILARDHEEAWARYLATGAVPTLDEITAEDVDEHSPAAPPLSDDEIEALLIASEDDDDDDDDGSAEHRESPSRPDVLSRKERLSSARSRRRREARASAADLRSAPSDEDGLASCRRTLTVDA